VLTQGASGPLTLVCAPAGFGKTALLAEWLHGRQAAGEPLRVAWLSVEADDNDPARFLTYLAAALDQAHPGTAQAVDDLLNSPRPLPMPPRLVMAHLISALAAGRSLPGAGATILVLDDYQTITTPEIHDAVAYLLDHLPTELHLVLATRADPPLPLARLRARGQLTEIRAADLCFSYDETERFINERMGLGLTPADVAALAARTEGWVTGLQLAALALRSLPDRPTGQGAEWATPPSRSRFVAAFAGSHQYIVDYLAEEVIARQPPEIREFLLRTCLLRRLCAPLCDVVAAGSVDGGDTSQAVLDHLERQNLFVVPLDGERRWFRYHPLFAEALLTVARPQPEAAADVHRRAAGWYADHGAPSEAIWHALAAGDFSTAADLVERSYMQLVQRGELMTLNGWLEALPRAVVEQRPRLCLASAWSQAYTASPAVFEQLLNQVDAALAEVPAEEAGPLRGELAVLRGVYASVYWRAAEAIGLAQQALELLPASNHRLRAVAFQALGNAYRLRGEVAAAEQAYREVLGYSQTGIGSLFGLLATARLGQVQQLQGRLRQAAESFQAVIEQAERLGGELAAYGGEASVHLAELHYEWDALDDARALLERGLKAVQHAHHVHAALPAYCLLARLEAAGGNLPAARRALERASRLVGDRRFPPAVETHLAGQQAELALRAGDLEAAADWAARAAAGPNDPALPRDVETISLARLSLAQGRPGEALRHLAAVQRTAEKQGRLATVMSCLTLAALAWHSQRETTKGLAALCQALAQAEPEGYVRLFTEAGPSMADLLTRVRGPSQAYALRLLARMQPVPGALPGTAPLRPLAAADPNLVEPLSSRELEVLQWLAEGASNRAIAEGLVISVGTVKTHISRIMGKLGARNRTEAVARARQLGLLA
jgi:LuxR family maltose regulon positive regulatory protein